MHLTPLLHAGYLGKLANTRMLQHVAGLADDQAAQLLFVSKQTYRRWGADRPVNLTAMRLLAIFAGYLPWNGWQGWEMHDGCLFPPGYTRGGLRPGDVMALPFLYQLLDEYKRQLGQGGAMSLSVLHEVVSLVGEHP